MKALAPVVDWPIRGKPLSEMIRVLGEILSMPRDAGPIGERALQITLHRRPATRPSLRQATRIRHCDEFGCAAGLLKLPARSM